MKYIYILSLLLLLTSCGRENTTKYALLDIKGNSKDMSIKDVPDFYYNGNQGIDSLIIFTDTLDVQTVKVKHTGGLWGDGAQIYKGASYIEISFPRSLEVFSYDWPQPAISSDPINTEIISGTIEEGDHFVSPIVIKLEHKFRNPASKNAINQKRTFKTGIGLGFKDNGKVIYYQLRFMSRVNLEHSGKFKRFKK